MKTLKLLFGFTLVAALFTSCISDDDFSNHNNNNISLDQLLNKYELWYVDIDETIGYRQVPFLQMAFTVSFQNGRLYANNNLVGFGEQGNGLGIPIGQYDAYGVILDTYHEIDGYDTFDVYQINTNTIELYNPYLDTSYCLRGYHRSNFDYDMVFYDNILYFLQEYEAWEKTYTSQAGQINEFDNENYLQFLSHNNDTEFRSSQDYGINNPNNIYWDYTGVYNVWDVPNNMYLKELVLNYDGFGNEHFELYVINDGLIELYHNASGTTYEFSGRGYIEFIRNAEGKQTNKPKMRKFKNTKKDNPRENTRNLQTTK